ncbi:urease accessory protein UreD [Pseudanabaena sp. PCC 6802]|uniref:urease accessory protein UreD n=1 Tax=Pseudanabaena sp. PCC 6802 TaxID=118173 RepID=UPI00034A425D|nr:urease accessory protein UreD [Pseudanabaena sp. PCC 6802]
MIGQESSIAKPPTDRNVWHGKLELDFANRDGATHVKHSYSQAPWKLQRPFYPEGDRICHSVLLHTAGGMVGGDRLSAEINLAENTHALITTAAAAKIYRSNGLIAQQSTRIQIAAGAYLEWLPQDSIIFDGAIYNQHLHVELAPQATWCGWEVCRYGRTARGESFLSGQVRSHTEVWQQGRPLWIDRQRLSGGADTIHSPHALAGQPVVANLAFIGQVIPTEIVEQARTLVKTAIKGEMQGEFGVTRLEQGIICRYRGASSLEARTWLIAVWQMLRVSFMGSSTCIPRIWQHNVN